VLTEGGPLRSQENLPAATIAWASGRSAKRRGEERPQAHGPRQNLPSETCLATATVKWNRLSILQGIDSCRTTAQERCWWKTAELATASSPRWPPHPRLDGFRSRPSSHAEAMRSSLARPPRLLHQQAEESLLQNKI